MTATVIQQNLPICRSDFHLFLRQPLEKIDNIQLDLHPDIGVCVCACAAFNVVYVLSVSRAWRTALPLAPVAAFT